MAHILSMQSSTTRMDCKQTSKSNKHNVALHFSAQHLHYAFMEMLLIRMLLGAGKASRASRL